MKDKWLGASGLVLNEPLIFEKGAKGRKAYSLPELDVEKVNPQKIWPQKFIRRELEGFPEMSEVDVVRHFTRLSQWNYGVDSGFYPLGSCTMKYNPKVNEEMARLPGFAGAHPYQPEEVGSQGALQLIYEPCQGLDVGATEFVQNKLTEAKKNKAGVLLISEDLDEILSLSDWVAAIYEGKIMGILPAEQAKKENVGAMMAGLPLKVSEI